MKAANLLVTLLLVAAPGAVFAQQAQQPEPAALQAESSDTTVSGTPTDPSAQNEPTESVMTAVPENPAAVAPGSQQDPVFPPPSPSDTVNSVPAIARSVELHALMQSLLLYRNDSDFDRTKSIYEPDGQSVGALATIFAPNLKLNVDKLSLFYAVEVGLNLWSQNNPDQFDPTASDTFFLKHRELFAQADQLGGFFSFKVGYQHISDPSGLMLNHWAGAVRLWFLDRPDGLVLSVGQVPDATYEGFIIDKNNFVHDTFFVQGHHRFLLVGDKVGMTAGVLVLSDNHVIGRKLTLATPMLGLDLHLGRHEAFANFVLQLGKSEFTATDEATHVASAFELHGALRWQYVEADLNALVLSGDDAYLGNDRSGAFLYSGKNHSSTILLTEDELRDRNDNFDERMGKKDGGFYELRSGLAVADLKLTGVFGDYLRPAIIAGLGFVTQSDNALGETFAGLELDADIGVVYKDLLALHLVGGMLLPGGAAGALVNRIDPFKTDNVYQILSTLSVRY